MKTLREQFEEEYAPIPYKTGTDGKVKIRYIYNAPWYLWNLPEHILRKKKRMLAGSSVISLGIFVISSSLPVGLNSWSFTAVAGICALAAHVLELFGIFRLLAARYHTTRMNYNYVNNIMRTVPWLHGGCLTGAFLAGIVYLPKASFDLWGFVAAAGYLICAGVAFYIALEYRKIPVETKKNQEYKEKRIGPK